MLPVATERRGRQDDRLAPRARRRRRHEHRWGPCAGRSGAVGDRIEAARRRRVHGRRLGVGRMCANRWGRIWAARGHLLPGKTGSRRRRASAPERAGGFGIFGGRRPIPVYLTNAAGADALPQQSAYQGRQRREKLADAALLSRAAEPLQQMSRRARGLHPAQRAEPCAVGASSRATSTSWRRRDSRLRPSPASELVTPGPATARSFLA
jgi:hypothetical protein